MNKKFSFIAAVKRLFVFLCPTRDNLNKETEAIDVVKIQPANEIWYTSSDGFIINPDETCTFGANIISNTYKNGKGVIEFDKNVTWIGGEAFSLCGSLKSIDISCNVTLIASWAFMHCTSLTSIIIPNSVTSIGVRAFSGCTSLTIVDIQETTAIYMGAFYKCTSLESIYCKAKTAPKLGEKVFEGISPTAKIYVPMESVEAYKKADGWKTYANIIEGYSF